jgi:hypothetical protein
MCVCGYEHADSSLAREPHILYSALAPQDVVVIAEIGLDGRLIPLPESCAMSTVTLDVARANGIRRLFTTPAKATALNAVKMQRRQRYESIKIVPIAHMVDLLKALW